MPDMTVPRGRRPDLFGRHPREWVRLLLLALVAAVLLLGLIRIGRQAVDGLAGHHAASTPAAAPQQQFSGLAGGYSGPPVVVLAAGQRQRALQGLCVVIVRDASSSVSTDIDPDGQVNKELAAVADAFAGSGLPADRVAAVVFADDAQSSGLVQPSDPVVASTLLNAPAGASTNFTAGLGAAGAAVAQCPAGAERAVVLVSDGESSPDDIRFALSSLPSGVQLRIVALDAGNWAARSADWGAAGRGAVVVRRLDAGVVALTVSRVMSDLTGQNYSTGFAVN